MLVQQPQSKSKIVTVQADGKLQEVSWNQQENQHFSAGAEKPIRFLDIIPVQPVARPLPGMTVYEINQQILFGWSRMVSIRVLCDPGACSLRVCKCLMFLTVHSLCKRFQRIQVHYIIIMSIMSTVFCLSCSFGSCQAFPGTWFHPAKNWCGWHMIYIRCNRLSLESRAGYTVEVTVN